MANKVCESLLNELAGTALFKLHQAASEIEYNFERKGHVFTHEASHCFSEIIAELFVEEKLGMFVHCLQEGCLGIILERVNVKLDLKVRLFHRFLDFKEDKCVEVAVFQM